MNLCMVEPHLSCCGGIRRIIEISNRLIHLGHKVTIFTPPGTPCSWLPCYAPVFPLSRMHKYEFDCVLFNLAEQYKWALDAKAKCKVFWVLAPEADYKNPKLPLKALMQDFHLLANSKFTVDYIRKYKKIAYDIPIISGGINPTHFRYDPKIPKQYHVVYYGSSRPWKGTKLIEQALLGMSLKVRKMEGLGTPQHDMYRLYNSSDITLTANQCEGFSFIELESMACGVPVVCTDNGGNRDYVKTGVNSLVVPRTVDGLKAGISNMLNDNSLRKRLRDNGLKTALDPKFNWDNITKQFEKYIEKLL